MKKLMLSAALFLLSFVGVGAQEWSAVVSSIDGLPGTLVTGSTAGDYYYFKTETYNLGSASTTKLRFIVLDTESHEMPNGNNYTFALSELAVYDGDGNKVSYTASSNADHNELWITEDGQGLPALSDNNYGTYFHSMWQKYLYVSDYHYIELQFTTPLSEFSLEWASRAEVTKNAPTKVAITLGTNYTPPAVGGEFTLGGKVTSASDFAVEGKMFVIKSNNIESFTTSGGAIYTGEGPIYMSYPEKGTKTASLENVVQFVPSGNGTYLIYWPMAQVFMANSASNYNSKNGWQYSTANVADAAEVQLFPLESGDFEMAYTATYPTDASATDVTDLLYIGADIRDNVSSKCKTFAPAKKTALENEDYTQGYALPVAFNWTIYNAELDASTVEELALSMSQIATSYLSVAVSSARGYIENYGDYNGACTQQLGALNSAIATAESYMAAGATPTIAQINEVKAVLETATVTYVAYNLNIYDARIDSIMGAVRFTSYPYETDTYPESSREMLETIKANITLAKEKTDTYSAAQFVSLYAQIDSDIAAFYATKISYLTLPINYTAEDGLPGSMYFYGGYVWDSPQIDLGRKVRGVRITFNANNMPEGSRKDYNGYPMISLAEFHLYDENGYQVTLTEEAFATNSQELTEGPMANICDSDTETHWHSIWSSGVMEPEGYVYLDVTFPEPMSVFSISLFGRNTGNLMPTDITLSSLKVVNKNDFDKENATYVYLTDGGVDAFLNSDLDGEYYTEGDFLCFPLKGGEVVYYTSQEYDSCSTVIPSFPELTSYKFNNKFNPNLHVDIEVDSIQADMYLQSNSIGKWLTASFKVSDDDAVVYVDTVLQVSKETRQSFAQNVAYTVTYPGYNRVAIAKVQDEVLSDAVTAVNLIPLTADMLSTNKPSTAASESVASLLDNNYSTFFHSTWGDANDATIDVDAYITCALPSPIENLQIYYCTRPTTGYNPLEWEIYASNDGNAWTLVRTLTTADGMPVGQALAEYTSPTIALGGSYSYIKILQTEGEYSKNHLVLSELRLYDVETGEPSVEQEAVYDIRRIPFGRTYNVIIDWLTDNAVSVPRIDIDIEDGRTVTSKDYYLKANFRITGYGVYDNFEDSVQIKGRGNSSWALSKKPYRLKFEEKVKPFGLTKGKSWVLLANAQKGSMMANAVAMKIGQMAGTEYANHIVPVEVYMNGVYMGSYMFTERVGMSNNSVDVDEDYGCLYELDQYYDEDYKFRSTYYNMYVNVKEPDLTEYTEDYADLRFNTIKTVFNNFDLALYSKQSLDAILDYNSFATFMLANDLVNNQELGHPKSVFLYKENLDDANSKLKFGPIWDFDWAFGYESTKSYCVSDYTASIFKSSMSNEPGYKMFYDLMADAKVQKYYYKTWVEFMNNNSIEELKDYMDCYYEFANSSFENNYYVWSDGMGYSAINDRMQQWVSDRATYLRENLTEYSIDNLLFPGGDANRNGYITVHDLALTTAYRNGNVHADFSKSAADVDGSGILTDKDVRSMEASVLNADPLTALQYYNIPMSIGELHMNNFELAVNEDYELPIQLVCYDNESYKAIQFDVIVPDGMLLLSVTGGGAITDHKICFTQRDMTTYRVVIYSTSDSMFAESNGDEAFLTFLINSYMVIPEENRSIAITNALIVDEDTDELRLNDMAASFGVSTNIYDVEAPTASAIGGEGCITIASLQAQQVNVFGVDGRIVRSMNVPVGTTRIEVPAGIYVVLGSKVVVR